jgi:hypothetical protein
VRLVTVCLDTQLVAGPLEVSAFLKRYALFINIQPDHIILLHDKLNMRLVSRGYNNAGCRFYQ